MILFLPAVQELMSFNHYSVCLALTAILLKGSNV